jgi:RNA polymerase sigma factor (sigma-70 family)
MTETPNTLWVNDRLVRHRDGDRAASRELIEFAIGRLERLAQKMLRGDFARLNRWVDSCDVFQSAAVRLWRALSTVTPESPLHFHRLAARQVRLELLDLARQFFGPQGQGANYESWNLPNQGDNSEIGGPDRPAVQPDPARIIEIAEIESIVRFLPEDERAVTDLLYYQGLSQEETADLLGVDVRTVQRRWQRAKRKLGARLTMPEEPAPDANREGRVEGNPEAPG